MRDRSVTNTRPEPGWYPDYDAAPGWERYWNGRDWTDGRREWLGTDRPRAQALRRVGRLGTVGGVRVPVWVYAAAAVLVALSAGVLIIGNDPPATSGGREVAGSRVEPGTPPPPASTPGPPTSQTAPTSQAAPAASTERQVWDVASVVDGHTLRLANGADVRLVGVAGGCAPGAAADWLSSHVAGSAVALIKDGADKDAGGHLLRYVSLDGNDVGLEMLRAGVATAAGGHTRAARYAAADTGCR